MLRGVRRRPCPRPPHHLALQPCACDFSSSIDGAVAGRVQVELLEELLPVTVKNFLVRGELRPRLARLPPPTPPSFFFFLLCLVNIKSCSARPSRRRQDLLSGANPHGFTYTGTHVHRIVKGSTIVLGDVEVRCGVGKERNAPPGGRIGRKERKGVERYKRDTRKSEREREKRVRKTGCCVASVHSPPQPLLYRPVPSCLTRWRFQGQERPGISFSL